MKRISPFKGMMFGLPLLGLLLNYGCAKTKAAPPQMNSIINNDKPRQLIFLYRDTTRSEQDSATILDADAYLSATLQAALKNAAKKRLEFHAEIFTTPPAGQSVGVSRHHIDWVGKVMTPRESGRQQKEQAEHLLSIFHEIEREPPVSEESAIIENLADLIRRLSELPYGDSADRTLIALTDLEEFKTDFLTASQITSANNTQFAKIIARVHALYPAVPRPPQRIIFVITTPKERSNERQRTRLRSFWTAVCKDWGIGEVEFINPPSQSLSPQGNPTAGKEKAPQTERHESTGPLDETKQGARKPTLAIANETPYRSILRLVSATDKARRVYELPSGKTTHLTLPEGRFGWRLEYPGKEINNSFGRCTFRPFRAYSTGFVETTGKGEPLTFGDPD